MGLKKAEQKDQRTEILWGQKCFFFKKIEKVNKNADLQKITFFSKWTENNYLRHVSFIHLFVC